MTTKLNQQVKEFHIAFGQAIETTPHIPADAVVRLRARLILEEAFEALEALFDDAYAIENLKATTLALASTALVNVDLPEFCDAMADLLYVIEGSAIATGVDLQAVTDVVHDANMRKAGGYRDEHGKWKKPAGWTPPDIDTELVRQGWVKP